MVYWSPLDEEVGTNINNNNTDTLCRTKNPHPVLLIYYTTTQQCATSPWRWRRWWFIIQKKRRECVAAWWTGGYALGWRFYDSSLDQKLYSLLIHILISGHMYFTTNREVAAWDSWWRCDLLCDTQRKVPGLQHHLQQQQQEAPRLCMTQSPARFSIYINSHNNIIKTMRVW